MKCVVDLDLLNPPPLPGTLHFGEMLLHQRRLRESDLKIALSQKLQEMLWSRWNQIKHPQHRDFLLKVLTRHRASGFPDDLVVETTQVNLEPPFLSGEPEWIILWLHSLMACYLDAEFSTDGALLATWPRDEFTSRQDVQVTYQSVVERLPIVRNEAEWDEWLAVLAQTPIPFSSDLRAYADESGFDHNEWIAVVVIAERDANRISESAITTFNRSKPPGCSDTEDIHLSELDQRGDAERREQARQKLAEQIVEGMCDIRVACFIVPRESGEDRIGLYARGLRRVLRVWHPDLICPIHVDTPYDRKDDEVKNRALRTRVFNEIQSAGFSCTSDDIVLSKSVYYPGLGIADAVAYLYRRRRETFWKDLWQRLVDQRCIELVYNP
jgi:hypothetical protein